MSSVLHPVGPEDKGTYWRRRLVVVLALVVVVVLVALGIRALTSSDDAAAQQPTKLDPSTVATTPTGTPSGTPTTGSTASATDTATATGTATATSTASRTGGACSAQALSLTLTSDYSAYGPGKTPKLVLTVKNTSQTACSVEIGTAVRTFTASADGKQVWSSADCQTQTASQVSDLQPGDSRAMSSTWSRQQSQSGCPTGQQMVPAGSYTIDGSWNGMDAQPVTITLTS